MRPSTPEECLCPRRPARELPSWDVSSMAALWYVPPFLRLPSSLLHRRPSSRRVLVAIPSPSFPGDGDDDGSLKYGNTDTLHQQIAADTRATSGPIVADKNCEKLHYISPQIWCAGAGTAADTEFTTALISSQLELHSLSTGRKPRVVTCMTLLKQHLFRYQGHIGAYLVVAGCDPTGTHLFTVHAHGSTDKLPYVTMGSGSLAAMSVFETQWKPSLTKEDAVKLTSDAIMAGIFNDLGSGSNVDVAIITKDKTTLKRNYIKPNERTTKLQSYSFPKGTTAVLNEKIIKKNDIGRYISVEEVPLDDEKMDVDT
ncbi:hypothetical protein AK830_g5605 [Neonectria ditissima]|uniref:proteasome endopeptidase complex n=1 Tax=Neonectria ditissima TaxID=78410 RepID=A0A0P7B3J1_9HYPO|nr:hypothetical protein AK830_g5605 [Neonectria ditissima]